jgi:DNA-binding NtrC family response regulator
MKHARLLIVDPELADQPAYLAAAQSVQAGPPTFEASTALALERLKTDSSDLVVLSEAAAGERLEGLADLRRAFPDLPVILVSPRASVDAVKAGLRLGAGDYLTKPLRPDELQASLARLLGQRRLGAEHELLRRQIERPYSFDDLIGTSPGMRKVYATIDQVADSDVPVLVTGPTGTGKELVARSLHRRSGRASGPFVPVDCGAIPENLLESEFFGHERGAFTGADTARIGLLEYADRGTLFLDELAELPLVLQAKLLRTLQERKIRRVGGRAEIDVDVRIVAATARDLEAMLKSGQFRQDLYYRINVVRIDLPPLAERGDDIGLLAEYFANRAAREMRRNVLGLTPEAYQVLRQYAWPGNVRELQNVIRRAVALSRDDSLDVDDLPEEIIVAAGERGDPAQQGYFQLRDQHVARFERQYLTDLLRRHKGDVKTAALEAKLPRGTLYRLLKNHDLDGASFRGG